MSEFLRDLSPTRTHDASRAVALLPSPFQTIQPLRAARFDSRQQSDTATQSQQRASVRASDVAGQSDRHERSADTPDRLDIASLAPHAPIDPRTSSSLPRLATADRVARERRVEGAHDSPLPTPLPAVAPTSLPARPLESRTRDARESSLEWARASRIESTPTRVDAATIPSPPRVAVSSSASAPLSTRALAARPSPTVGQRPVVHVTIDRVEVYAPAAPAAPPPPSRSRTRPASVSLNDYLRGHDRERRGGRS